MLSKLKTPYLIAVSVVVCVLVGLGGLVVAKGLIDQITFNNRVLSKKTAAKKQLEANLAVIPQLQTNFAGLNGLDQLIMRSLPEKADFPGLAATMEFLTGASNTKLKSIAVIGLTPQPAGQAPVELKTVAEVEGNYAGLIEFFKNIQLANRPMKADSMRITGTGNKLTGTFEMSTYFQGPADIKPQIEEVR